MVSLLPILPQRMHGLQLVNSFHKISNMPPEDISLVKRNLKFCSYYRCLPVKWDSKLEKIVVLGTKSQKLVILSVFANFFVALSRIFATFTNSSSVMARSEAAIGAVIYTTGFLLRFDLPVDEVAVELLNFLIRLGNNEFGMSVLYHDYRIPNRWAMFLGFQWMLNEYWVLPYSPGST